jgi:pyruvate kinase
MSHADHATHAETIANVREAKESGKPISILCDLQGRSCAWAPSRKAAR